jgi:hypothetical protein
MALLEARAALDKALCDAHAAIIAEVDGTEHGEKAHRLMDLMERVTRDLRAERLRGWPGFATNAYAEGREETIAYLERGDNEGSMR